MNIYWYCPESVTRDFLDPLDNPSFRLRCFNVHTKLLENGYNSKIVSDVRLINDPDVVVLMSFGEQEYQLAKQISEWGKSVVHDYSENIRGIPILEETKKLCKYIVCCSTWLAQEEKKVYGKKVKVIRDMYEPTPVVHNKDFKRDKLKVVWSGMSGNAELVSSLLKPVIEKNDMEYVEISNRRESTIKWNRHYWKFQMAACDIAICPQAHWQFPAKSNVKVTTAMSLGIPVIASPIQSYLEVIDNGLNGFIANDLEDWDNHLRFLKDPLKRARIADRAFRKLEDYSQEKIYQQWLYTFRQCTS